MRDLDSRRYLRTTGQEQSGDDVPARRNDHTCSRTRRITAHYNMASASALAGAFTSLGVSANRAAAGKTNVVAKKVRCAALVMTLTRGTNMNETHARNRRHRSRFQEGRCGRMFMTRSRTRHRGSTLPSITHRFPV